MDTHSHVRKGKKAQGKQVKTREYNDGKQQGWTHRPAWYGCAPILAVKPDGTLWRFSFIG